MNNEIYQLSAVLRTEDSLQASISYDAAHPVFGGHFPGNPIVPGVCTLNMISDLVREHNGHGYVLDAASNVKFLQLIRPADRPLLKLSWKRQDEGLQVNASLEQEGAVMMRFAGTFLKG